MQPFSLSELLEIASDPMSRLLAPLPLHRQPERMDEVRYHFDLGVLQAREGNISPDVTAEEAAGCDWLEAYLSGWEMGRKERAAA
jgi:hypothetical protein